METKNDNQEGVHIASGKSIHLVSRAAKRGAERTAYPRALGSMEPHKLLYSQGPHLDSGGTSSENPEEVRGF